MSALITYIVMPDNLIFLAIELSLTKCLSCPLTHSHSSLNCAAPAVYINSFLAMLNARQSIRGKNEEGVSINLSELRSGTGTFPGTSGYSQTSPGGIHKKQLGIREVSEVELANGETKSSFMWPMPIQPPEA
ncbi:hypothetical protein PILCRDRAFT_485190 [Piloderma croceum F 1598]|uniref:Uncharacterized protein n=1 Tax=Piloderma croceum (strain F 1598) TaxID=765440 RepID=A0A0C3B7B4_PILCF|nr:hypothetical protein PILCRDRAFT_485190 [Piloderma croceum F 1598]